MKLKNSTETIVQQSSVDILRQIYSTHARQRIVTELESRPHALVFHVVRRSASLERFTLEALEWFRRSHGVNPRRLRSSGEVRTADQLAELEPEVARLAALTAAGGSRLRAALANETPN